MKKLLFIALLCATTATMAYADNSVAPGQSGGASVAAPPSAGGGTTGAGQGERREEKFAEVKARVLQKIQTHMTEIQQREACVNAATDFPALKACLPEKGEGHGRWGNNGNGNGNGNGGGNNGVGGGFGGGRFNNRGNGGGNNTAPAQ